MTIQQLVDKFIASPSYLPQGNPYLADKFDSSIEEILEAKKVAREVFEDLDKESDLTSTIHSYLNFAEVDSTFSERTVSVSNETGEIKGTITTKEEVLQQSFFFEYFNVDPKLFLISSFWSKSHKSGNHTYSVLFKKKDSVEAVKSNLSELLESIKPLSPKKKDYLFEVESSANLAVVCLFDAHIGKMFYTREGVMKNDLEAQKENFLKTLKDIGRKLSVVNVEKIIFPIGNDYFNSETTLTTTKGTNQDTINPQEMFRYGLETLIMAIDYLSEYCEVEVTLVRGNHAENLESMLATSLKAFYTNNKRVNVDDSSFPRKYYQWGSTGLMFEHGLLKPERYYELFTTEGKEIYSNTTTQEVILGDKHREITVSKGTVSIRWLGALSVNDKWHTDNGFVTGLRRAYCMVYNKEEGRILEFSQTIKNEELS